MEKQQADIEWYDTAKKKKKSKAEDHGRKKKGANRNGMVERGRKEENIWRKVAEEEIIRVELLRGVQMKNNGKTIEEEGGSTYGL